MSEAQEPEKNFHTFADLLKDGRKQDRRIEDLEQRIVDLELELSKCLDACRFLHRYYVNGVQHGHWPLER